MFDTHCHLQFDVFEGKVDALIKEASDAGVDHIVVPGTDVATSQQAVEIVQRFDTVYAAVGIHPHHVYEMRDEKSQLQNPNFKSTIKQQLETLDRLIVGQKVVAVGEVGLDRHVYKKTKYGEYRVDESFISLQKELLISQLELVKRYKKSVIIHNRETKDELLDILHDRWTSEFAERMVFHCCEPDGELLDFAKKHQIYIGVDGDITYRKDKQEFIKQVPLELLVLETDAPFLTPEPIRSEKKTPNKPAYLKFIVNHVARLKRREEEEINITTFFNAKKLFQLP